MRDTFRKWATRLAIFVVGGIFIAVLGQWFIQVATDKGFYKGAGGKFDAVMSMLFYIFTSNEAFYVGMALSCLVVGAWIDTILGKWDNRNADNLWWQSVGSFTIESAACMLADIKPDRYSSSLTAQAKAADLIALVKQGSMPTAFEDVARQVVDAQASNSTPYEKKPADLTTSISRRTLEKYARGKKLSLPWGEASYMDDINTEALRAVLPSTSILQRLIDAGQLYEKK